MQPPNSTHLKAAAGWLELGNYQEAFNELEEIEPQWRTPPDVLEARWFIYEMAEKWRFCIEIGEEDFVEGGGNLFFQVCFHSERKTRFSA